MPTRDDLWVAVEVADSAAAVADSAAAVADSQVAVSEVAASVLGKSIFYYYC